MSRVALFTRRRIASIACAVGLSLLFAAPLSAQQGEIIPGSECATGARPVTFLGDILATPVAMDDYVAPTGIPTGEAPDAETLAEINATIRQFIACSNSGEVLRALALFDDEYLRRALNLEAGIDIDQAMAIAETLATPIAIADDQLVVLVNVVTIAQLPDGDVAVVLETDGGQPNPEGTDVDLFILEKRGDEWIIIDAVNDIDDIEAQNTPAADS